MKKYFVPSLVGLLLAASPSFAQNLFNDNFDSDSTANWTIRQGGGTDSFADFYFDYSTLGIPSAPNSTGGSTRGMRFLVNQGLDPATTTGVFQGITAFPNGQSFQGNYRVRFDMWLNYVGPLGAGGSGSTQCGSFGVGATGSSAMWAGGSPAGVMLAASTDGNSADDYRCYSNSVHLAVATGAYAAGSRNNTATYYTTNFPANTAPTAQVALYSEQSGTTLAGSAGFAWRDIVVEKVDNVVTWKMDGKLIATSQTPANFADQIFFGMFDINGGASTNLNDHLNAALFDNIRVESLGTSVGVTASSPNADESGATGQFTFNRIGDTSASLTVDFTLTGTATNGVDYTTVATSVVIPAGQSSATVDISPINDSIAELSETVIATISASPNYSVSTASATVTIADNETPELSLSVVQPSMYERVTDDYIKFRITRKGDLNQWVTANVSYSGNANSARYTGPVTVDVESTFATKDFNVSPVNDASVNTGDTITATIASGAGYTVGAPASASGTIIDDEYGPETVLFSDSLSTDSSAQWTRRFGANNAIDDFTAAFGYLLFNDYIPDAPNGSQTALKVTVNKDEGSSSGSAGINLYPNGQSFSGNYAVRFDLYMQQNSSVGTTEFALFGINHSGNKTNWFLSGTAVNPPLDNDGLWFSMISDASGSAPGDYVLFTGNGASSGPASVATAAATSFVNAFKRPPYSAGSGAGVPGNIGTSVTKSWADVEIKKIDDVVTLSINKTPIVQYTNTTGYTTGNIMLGYMDPYASVGSVGGAVYYSNLRVVQLAPSVVQKPVITAVRIVGSNLQVDFTADAASPIGDLQLLGTDNVDGSFSAVAGSSVTEIGQGSYRATVPVSGSKKFFRIQDN